MGSHHFGRSLLPFASAVCLALMHSVRFWISQPNVSLCLGTVPRVSVLARNQLQPHPASRKRTLKKPKLRSRPRPKLVTHKFSPGKRKPRHDGKHDAITRLGLGDASFPRLLNKKKRLRKCWQVGNPVPQNRWFVLACLDSVNSPDTLEKEGPRFESQLGWWPFYARFGYTKTNIVVSCFLD